MPFNNRSLSLINSARGRCIAGCGGKKEPETLVRPVRSEIVDRRRERRQRDVHRRDPLALRDRPELPGGRQAREPRGRCGRDREEGPVARAARPDRSAVRRRRGARRGAGRAIGSRPLAQRRGAVSRPAGARPDHPRAVPGATDGGALPPRPNYRRPPRSCAWRSSAWATPRCAPAKTAWSRACMVEVGTVVAAGQRALSIARPSELEAVFDVPDGRIGEVQSRLVGADQSAERRERRLGRARARDQPQRRSGDAHLPGAHHDRESAGLVAARHDGERDAGARRRRAQHRAAVHRDLPEGRQARGVDRHGRQHRGTARRHRRALRHRPRVRRRRHSHR